MKDTISRKARVLMSTQLLVMSFIFSGCSFFTPRASTVFEPAKEFSRTYEDIAPEEEHVIGRAVAARILGRYRVLNNASLNDYLARIGLTLAAKSSRPDPFAGYSFALLESDEVNAMATPSGFVFITTGLLRLLDDEDALASILAHEISHVTQRHGLQVIDPEHYGSYIQIGGVAASAIDCSGLTQQTAAAFSKAVGDVFDTLVFKGYSRQQEYEADQGARELLTKSGYRSSALNNVLGILSQTPGKTGGWFSTHPNPRERLTQLPAISTDSPNTHKGFEVRRTRFKEACKGAPIR
jgi:predicted Zn-dependent protease